jgi:hypothetical protein
MDFAKAFSFVFDDEDWVTKIVIGGLVSLIPIVGELLLLGYMIAIARNVIRGNPQALPDWSDFGQMLVEGLFAFIINLVYALPILIVVCVLWLPAMVVGGALGDNGDVGVIGGLASCCFGVFAFIYGIAMAWFFVPAAMGRYADTGDFMSALRFGEILALTRANPIVYLMVLLVTMVAGFVASFGVILCFVGVLFTGFYANCVTGYAYGQAYLTASEQAVGIE